MSKAKAVILCGPSQSGKSYLTELYGAPGPIRPDRARDSNSLVIGDGYKSCTKALRLRAIGGLSLIDSVGFPDTAARNNDLNLAIFNLLLGLTISESEFERAINEYGTAMRDAANMPAADIVRAVQDLASFKRQASMAGFMGRVGAVLFVIPCQHRKMLGPTGSDVPALEDFWSMCGGWRILGANTNGTMAIMNNHNHPSVAARWSREVSKDFAENFWFGKHDAVALIDDWEEAYSVMNEWVVAGVENICSRPAEPIRVKRLLETGEMPPVTNSYTENSAKKMHAKKTLASWAGLRIVFDSRELPVL